MYYLYQYFQFKSHNRFRNRRINKYFTIIHIITTIAIISAINTTSNPFLPGASGTLDLEPYANPGVTQLTWSANGRPLELEPGLTPEGHRVIQPSNNVSGAFRSVVHGGRLLVLHNIRRQQTGKYTLVARNARGEARISFFLNVTCESY
ncbi:unnamed protein product [Protopolystoma xenopodis]|uniref:Immunoglobulin I-set domain-containing protein n=1 Tax=Protopolystoma xenopodis TaxID=117903 RepID=A0A448WB88_9PLAT|nr:unnamed protein product [Protopolystoma xenopodis]